MSIDSFIAEIEVEIDDLEKGILKPTTNYREIEDWSSMHALIIIALVDTSYNVTLSGEDLRGNETVQDLFDLIKRRTN
jgi:acyl carrier protein